MEQDKILIVDLTLDEPGAMPELLGEYSMPANMTEPLDFDDDSPADEVIPEPRRES